MINKITIENIKGIENKTFELNINPNIPSIFVAPNGFGKSSFAIAFNSLNKKKLKLDEDYRHKNNQNLLPKIVIECDNHIYEADKDKNDISREIGSFVINNKLFAKGKGSQYGTATATLNIEDITLVDKIPNKMNFNFYSYSEFKKNFGSNGKILPNLNEIFSKKSLIKEISEKYNCLEKANKKKIDKIINEINSRKETTIEIKKWILKCKIEELKSIDYLDIISSLICKHNFDEVDSYLYTIQLIQLYSLQKQKFKDVCKYNNYLLEKRKFDDLLTSFNTTWKEIKTMETNNKLVVKFPLAKDISNGQRDTLTFIAMLFKAKEKLNKQKNILIIDEVFDYLDDANLISLQFHVSILIKEFKKERREIYPIILTHLDPNYFKNFVFKKQQIYYLNKGNSEVNEHFMKLLKIRNNEEIKKDVSKYLLHYHTDKINKREKFKELNLKEKWGEGTNFKEYIEGEIKKYFNDEDYDPFAVCCAVRVKIEELTYNMINEQDKKEFLNTHKTKEKLDYAQSKIENIPESFYLLGVIYNEAMHWKDNQDNITPIVTKLKNLTIKNMIRKIYNK